MKVLIDINHPAHVHLFRNIISDLESKKINTVVTASRKDISIELLNLYKIPFIDLGSYGDSPVQKAINVPLMAFKMFRVVKTEKPDLMMGIGSSRIAHAGVIAGTPSWVLTDTEHASEQILLFKPFAGKIFTPDCFYKNLGKKQVKYPSYHELAYLHPNRFSPDFEVVEKLGIKKGEKFFLLRFVSWNASHDIGQKGLSNNDKSSLVEELLKYGRVIISSECALPDDLKKFQIKIPLHFVHHLIYFAHAYIGEGGTMASEAAVLGTPSIFISSLKLGYLQELQDKYGLMYSFKNYNEAIETIRYVLNEHHIKDIWKKRRELLLAEKVDLTDYMLNQISKFQVD